MERLSFFRKTLTVVLALGIGFSVIGEEIGYIETFSLSDKRDDALKQLIPGTRDYYYYNCLHQQNLGNYDEVNNILAKWIKRYGYTGRVEEIRLRQALLTYAQNGKKTLDFIRNRLGLYFSHQKEIMNRKYNYPTILDQKLIGFDSYYNQAMRRYKNSTHGFTDLGLEYLARMDMNANVRRDLLRRLKRPDIPKLPELIVADLKHKYSRGFGGMPIHYQLTLKQLERCMKLEPKLRNETNFVNAYLSKLRPNKMIDSSPEREKAHLDRIWAFVKTLSPVHNSLKANVLYSILKFNITRGVYDKALFMEYIQLPRNVFYMNPIYMRRPENRHNQVNFYQNYYQQTLLPPVRSDYELIKDYLLHFFVKAEDYKEFSNYLRDTVLKECFATAKILRGLGDHERWYSMLSPAQYKALKERVDLDFLPTNKKEFGSDEPVSLSLKIKNVKKLFVKVYKLNAANYYKTYKDEPKLNLNLEGLVTNWTQSYDYKQIPQHQHQETFSFPELKDRGIYIIEFIGGGKNSRALVRKGRLRFFEQVSAAGHLFHIFNDKGEWVKDGSIWMNNHTYKAQKDGLIAIPFSNEPGPKKIIISQDTFSSLGEFYQQTENYSLKAGFFVPREALVRGKKAKVLIRPMLYVNDVPVTLTVLTDTKLTILTQDLNNISSSKIVENFKLDPDQDTEYEFMVPDNLTQLIFVLSAKVRNISKNKDDNLSVMRTFALNGINATVNFQELLLRDIADKYEVSCLNKDGTRLPDRPISFQFHHKCFTNTIFAALKTAPNGITGLGELQDIDHFTATMPGAPGFSYVLGKDSATYPAVMNLKAGEGTRLPFMQKSAKLSSLQVSLLEKIDNTYYQDCSDKLKLENGNMLKISGLTPGVYDLILKEPFRIIKLNVCEGRRIDDILISRLRVSQLSEVKALQINSVKAAKDQIAVSLSNVDSATRVHVFPSRYIQSYKMFASLGGLPFAPPEMLTWPQNLSSFQSGVKLSEEYEYIIHRRLAKKFAGNMLERPGLILNPFELRKTQTRETEQAKGGGKFLRRGAESQVAKPKQHAVWGYLHEPPQAVATQAYTAIDFLARPAPLLCNLKPDKNGIVMIPFEKLGRRQDIHVVAVNDRETVYRQLSLPKKNMQVRDISLTRSFNPKKHFVETRKISALKAGQKLEIDDLFNSQFEVFDSLGKIFRLYYTLLKERSTPPIADVPVVRDPVLAQTANVAVDHAYRDYASILQEFQFIVKWDKLSEDEKREQYSKYACHELNYFIYHKDKPFFDKVVKPYLVNKMDKTFMDKWLISANLASYGACPFYRARLNVVEKILMGMSLKGEMPATRRFVKEAYDMLPQNPVRFNHLFDTAVKSGALEVGGAGVRLAELRESFEQPADEEEEVADEVSAMTNTAAAAAPQKTPGPSRALGLTGSASLQKRKAVKAKLALVADKKGVVYKEVAEGVNKQDALKSNVGWKVSRGKDMEQKKRDRAMVANLRQSVVQYYRKLDQTREYAENNYYKLPIGVQNCNLVKVNAYWNDYSKSNGKTPFISANFADASQNFTEVLLAMGSMDLPFKGCYKADINDGRVLIQAEKPVVVFHKEIAEAESVPGKTIILVAQNYFNNNDRYTYINNEQYEKYVKDEFIINTVYGCKIVVTNPTMTPMKLDVLMQIPKGAVPVNRGFYTKSQHMNLGGYSTQTFTYFFYFPKPGKYVHYPVQVSSNEKLLGFASVEELNVVETPSKIDKTSWQYISQNGSDQDVINYLKTNNLNRTDLNKIAFRMRDKAFFDTILGMLARNHSYNNILWSYSIYHNSPEYIRQYLPYTHLANQAGDYIVSPLLTLDPVVRRKFQFLEYKPFVNPRTYQLGKIRKIQNDAIFEQYNKLLKILSYKKDFDSDDLLSVTYYLLLQKRIEEAITFFAKVDPKKVTTRIQYDYCNAYVDFYLQKPSEALKIANTYKEYKVPKWRNKFLEIINQVNEIRGRKVALIDKDSREMQMSLLASKEPTLEAKLDDTKVKLSYQNIKECRVRYYLMDIEFLFSKKPFSKDYGALFAFVEPNRVVDMKLDTQSNKGMFEIPKDYQARNLLVEISSAGKTARVNYFANSMLISLEENYGQLKATRSADNSVLPKVYVKVYARMKNGVVKYYKDGYTDLRGRFDYASLNTDELTNVDKFAILIMSEKNGSTVKEAGPPKR